MRAVVVATGYCPGMEEFAGRHPPALLPLAGRPLIHYVVEALVDRGVAKIDFILSENPTRIEESLGDGTRWGCSFRFHLARQSAVPYSRLTLIDAEPDEPVILAHGDRLPFWGGESPTQLDLSCHNGEWTGWALISGARLRAIAGDVGDCDEAGLFSRLSSEPGASTPSVDLMLDVRSFEGLLAANWAVLERRFPKLLMGARDTGESVWISRNVSLHPTARITPPIFIGENCRINAGVQLGPHAVIGADCLVDQSSSVAETVIFAGSYVGQGLELNQSIVDRNRLVSVKAATEIVVADNFILGSFVDRDLQHFAKRMRSRIVAAFLLLATSPLQLFAWLWCALFRKGPAICRREVVRLPAQEGLDYSVYNLIGFCPSAEHHGNRGPAHDFFMHFLPGLWNVLAGDLTLIGVAPRAAAEIEVLPLDWKQLYTGSVGGLITEAFVMHGPAPSEDQLYSSEVFYAATANPRHDFALALGYLARLLHLKRSQQPIETPAGMEE